jgi:NAD(P)H dehydrogenase (quinone)
MIVVTGATGQLGRAILDSLRRRAPGVPLGASTREPAEAAELARQGVRVREGDFARPETLGHAFEGATQLLVVSSNARAQGADPIAQHRAVIEAARAAGVRRVLYTSHMGASRTSAFAPMHDHAATEELLADSGLAWTSLRNGFYAASALGFMGDAFTSGSVDAPRDGKVSWTTHADLAEATAAILLEEGSFDGPTPPLTGAEALDLNDLAQLAAEITGRPMKRRVLSDDDLAARLAARGAPPGLAEIALGFYRASRAGELAATDPTLARLVGRRPTSMREVLARRLAS